MKECVIGIHVESDGNIILRMRKNNFNVLFGKVKEVEKKIQNFKAFYNKTKQDSLLTSYSLVNLKFNNQVVATKR